MTLKISDTLMPGNYHEGPDLSHPRLGITAIKIDEKTFSAITAYGIHMVEEGKIEFKPLLLTKDWLIGFGFKKDYNDFEIYKKGIYTISIIRHATHFFYVEENHDLISEPLNIHLSTISYVHELQNLYFCLTKEKLSL